LKIDFTYKKHQLIILLLFTILIYVNTIPNKYSLDDEYVTYNNLQVQKGISAIPEIFTSHYSNMGEKNFGYRPVVKTSFAIEYELFGENPHISHGINLLIYALLIAVTFLVIRRMLKDFNPLIPFFIVLLFAAHPIHTEVVASLKNRDELFSYLFGILSLWLFIRYADTEKKMYVAAALICYLTGFLSKPGIVVFFILIPLTLYFFTDLKIKKILFIFALLLIITLILKYFPRFILPETDRPVEYYENPIYYEKGIFKRFALVFNSLGYYLKFLFYPYPLRYYYGYNQVEMQGFLNPWVLGSLIVHFSLFIYALLTFRKKSIYSYSILFYLISVSIFTNLLKPVMGIIGERFVFTASLGFCIALVFLIFKIACVKPVAALIKTSKLFTIVSILILVTIIYSAVTIKRNPDWKTHMSLYVHDIKFLENSVKANELLAFKIMETVYADFNSGKDVSKHLKDIKTAENCYLKSLQLYFENEKTWLNLGSLYSNFYGDYKQAIFSYSQILKFNDESAKAYMNIGKCYDMMKEFDKAEQFYIKALKFDPENTDAISQLSKIFNNKGKTEEAINLNYKLMKIIPDSELPYINIANFLYLSGDTVQAMQFAEKAIVKNPDNYKVCMMLSDYFKMHGDSKKQTYYEVLATKASKKQK